jgi:aquaporin Z
MTTARLAAAEFFGTLWLVLGGCGTAVLAATFPGTGVGFVGVALAFGLTVLTAAYAVGAISGGHFNPAVSVGLWAAGRFPGRDLPVYLLAQVGGAIAGAGILYAIASGSPAFELQAGFACNGYGAHSPGHYAIGAAAVCEIVLTAGFLIVICGVTDPKTGLRDMGPLAIGLALTLIHLISIPVTNTSVNPARSTGVALFAGGWAARQLWFFWLMPTLGGTLGGLIYRAMTASVRTQRRVREKAVPASGQQSSPA